MKNVSGNRIKEIINKEFDGRLANAVIAYIVNIGWENCQKITEEEILDQCKGNGLMTARFEQALVRTAVKICNECNFFDDFLPFIVLEMYVSSAPMENIVLYQDDFNDNDSWEEVLSNFNRYGYDEIEEEKMPYGVEIRACIVNKIFN